MSVKKITVTGTKGKTTVVNVLADVLMALGEKSVLHVNTTGHFVNGERKSTLSDSSEVWGLVPSVSPGRYLYEFLGSDKPAVAVLEASLGSSSSSGLGYRAHDVGIFLNVFEDHLGSSDRLKSREDIFEAKSFIAKRLGVGGSLVLNFDDELVVSSADLVPEARSAKIIFFGLDLTEETVRKKHTHASFVTVRGGKVIYVKEDGEVTEVVSVGDVVWTFDGKFLPSVYNLMAIAGGVIGHYGEVPTGLNKALKASRLDPYGGRLTLLKSNRGTLILADYAHEKKSMCAVGDLARGLVKNEVKVIGVVRLAYDRTDELIKDTGIAIASHYDHLVVYDKIDGHFKQPKEILSNRFKQEIGKVSSLLHQAISEVNPNCERIIREDQALERAAELAGPGDIVVVIVNDNIERSIALIKEKFAADFV